MVYLKYKERGKNMNVRELKEVLRECTGCTLVGRYYESIHKVPRVFDRREVIGIDVAGTDYIIITLEGEEEEEEEDC